MNTAGGSRKEVFGWSLYDWANSAFTTLVVTFVYGTYFTPAIAPNEIVGTELWSRAIMLSGLIIAVLSPVLGALADRGGTRKSFLLIATLSCVLTTAALTFVAPGSPHAVLLALGLFVIANVAFEVGMVFYNALLPSLASPEKIGRISGYGWGLGYIGGLGCLSVALAVLVREVPLFGISTEAGFNFRATNLLVAGWFLLFSMPLFVLVRDRQPATGDARIGAALGELAATFRNLRGHRDIVLFLVARLFYNDGLVTVFAFGGIYAAGTFGMSLSEVIQFGIVINVAAGLGAWIFGFVDDRLGGKTTILITLGALALFTTVAVLAPDRTWLWVAAVGIGAFVGPNQAVSRSLMGRLVPASRHNEFFGFFAFSGKITSFMGPLLLGVVTAATESQRAGVATVLGFFVVGAALLCFVDEKRGIEASPG